MTLLFVEPARDEFLSALSYYAGIDDRLGQRLKEEAEYCFSLIADNPELFRLRNSGYRRVNLRIFPYYIAYMTRDTNLWILAFAHGYRQPEYWIRRKDNIQG